jgi:hypothetical protein
MLADLRNRFWVEVALGSLTAALVLVTLVWPQWIEMIFGVEPDGGNGSLEWAVVGALSLTTICFLLLARAEWRRAVTTSENS